MPSNPPKPHPPALSPVPPPSDRRSTPEPRIDDDELAGFEKSLLFVDDLTGLYNRRFLSHLFADRWDDLTGPSERLSLVIIDLDLFKDVNDTYGHLAGDHVLQEIGELLKQHFRRRDFVIRYGGDEFVIVLPGADRAEARTLARRTREAMAAHRFTVRETAEPIAVPLSFSLGTASYPEDGDHGEGALAAADRRLYADKRKRQGASSGRRLRGAALGVALLAALVAGVFTLNRGPEPGIPEDGPEGTGATSSVEAELRERILELQAELETVPVEHPPTRDVYTDYEEQIRELESRIVELQTELEKRPRPAPPQDENPRSDVPRSGAPAIDDRPTDETKAEAGVEKPDSGASPSGEMDGDGSAASLAAAAPPPAGPAPADIVRPSPISSVNARYPAAAVRLRREAVVLVRVLVDAGGQARRAEVVGKRAGLGFDEAASTAALGAVYRPGTRDGEAVEMETLLKVEFKLRD